MSDDQKKAVSKLKAMRTSLEALPLTDYEKRTISSLLTHAIERNSK